MYNHSKMYHGLNQFGNKHSRSLLRVQLSPQPLTADVPSTRCDRWRLWASGRIFTESVSQSISSVRRESVTCEPLSSKDSPTNQTDASSGQLGYSIEDKKERTWVARRWEKTLSWALPMLVLQIPHLHSFSGAQLSPTAHTLFNTKKC